MMMMMMVITREREIDQPVSWRSEPYFALVDADQNKLQRLSRCDDGDYAEAASRRFWGPLT